MSIHMFNPSGTSAPAQTTLASQGGLLVSIDGATGDIARTTVDWIEDEKYGMYLLQDAAALSTEFDTAVLRTGTKTLKLSTTNATGAGNVSMIPEDLFSSTSIATLSKYAIQMKASTKYKLTCWAKTTNVAASSVCLRIRGWDNTTGNATGAAVSSNFLSGTNDWTLLSINFTTAANASQSLAVTFQNSVAGNISDAWFDINSMTLEEVVEPVADSLTSSSPSLVSFTAVGSTDNIDQSSLTTVNNAMGIGNQAGLNYLQSQSFTATKSKLTGVYLYKSANVGTPTGNLKVEIRTNNVGNPSATILATYTMPLATYNALSVGEFLVNVPCNLTAGTLYHIVVSNTATEALNNRFVLGGTTVGTYSGGDLRLSSDGGTVWVVNGTTDAYFKTLYYKPTTNFKASQNNSTMQISADEDGFLNGAVINRINGTYNYTPTADVGTSFLPSLYSYTSPSGDTANTFTIISTDQLIKSSISGTHICTFKANIPNATSITISGTVRRSSVEWSYDNSSWTMINNNIATSTFIPFTTTIPASGSDIFVRFTSGSGSLGSYIGATTNPFTITASLDTSSLSTLHNYPTNKDIIKQYSTTLGSATTSATYRATKWGFPAVEYSSTEYQYLDVDTTATGSTVAFSELGVAYTPVADGASIAITSTSTPNIFVKANITANRIYLSSNDLNASSDKDGSMKQSVVYQVAQNPIYSRNTSLSQGGKNWMRLTYG